MGVPELQQLGTKCSPSSKTGADGPFPALLIPQGLTAETLWVLLLLTI